MALTRVLIWGGIGQDGYCLSEFLLEQPGIEVIAVKRRSSSAAHKAPHLFSSDRYHLIEGDITDPHSVREISRRWLPEYVFNLAAQSHVATSFQQPSLTWQTNYGGVLNLLETLREFPAKFYQASTSEMFGGQVGPDGRQSETTPFAPNSPYAVSKLAAHHLVRVYRESYGLHASCGVLFNHTHHSYRPPEFVCRKIPRYLGQLIKAQQKGYLIPKLQLGNLTAQRDWGWAPDYVRGMWLMLQQEKPGDYVLATGETYTVQEYLEACFDYAGVSWPDHLETSPELLRPCEVPYLCGDASLAFRVLGWKPRVNFQQLVMRMVEGNIG